MQDREWERLWRRLYTEGWEAQSPPSSPARGCLLALALGLALWTAALAVGLWWWP